MTKRKIPGAKPGSYMLELLLDMEKMELIQVDEKTGVWTLTDKGKTVAEIAAATDADTLDDIPGKIQ